MLTTKTCLLLFVTLASVTAQTFQYSRGWTNGKRDGHRREDIRELPAREAARGLSASLERISPCQINKLKYLLEGKLLYNDLLYIPCDSQDEDSDREMAPKQRYKAERSQEPLFEVFQ